MFLRARNSEHRSVYTAGKNEIKTERDGRFLRRQQFCVQRSTVGIKDGRGGGGQPSPSHSLPPPPPLHHVVEILPHVCSPPPRDRRKPNNGNNHHRRCAGVDKIAIFFSECCQRKNMSWLAVPSRGGFYVYFYRCLFSLDFCFLFFAVADQERERV